MDTTIAVPAQESRAERTPPDHQNLPPAFDARRWPIIAKHVFGLAPERTVRAAAKTQPALRLISNRPLPPTDDVVAIDIERLAWSAYVAAFDANDRHRSVATERCRDAAFDAWQHVFLLDEHGSQLKELRDGVQGDAS